MSQLAIKPTMRGVPLVYMRTWCEEVVELIRAGVAIAEESSEATCHPLLTALGMLPELLQGDALASGRVHEHHSTRHFRQVLLAG